MVEKEILNIRDLQRNSTDILFRIIKKGDSFTLTYHGLEFAELIPATGKNSKSKDRISVTQMIHAKEVFDRVFTKRQSIIVTYHKNDVAELKPIQFKKSKTA